jgi:hypothetical protein
VSALALAAALALCATPFTWPRPDVVEEIDVPDTVVSSGVPVRLHVIRSRLGAQALLETFGRAFVQAGFWVPPVQRRIVAEPHVTGLDWRGLVSYSAILHPNDDGSTTCVLGEARLDRKRDAAPDFAPALPGARDVLRVEQEGARVLSFTAAGSADDVRRFYRASLPSAGFKPSRDEDGVFERGAERLTVLPTAERAGGVSVVVVLVQRGSGP